MASAVENTKVIMSNEYEAEDVYESFQSGEACRELVRMLLNSGLLPDILLECSDFLQEGDFQVRSNKNGTFIDQLRKRAKLLFDESL